MNSEYYKPIEFGATIPLNNVHAFSVSMPTIQDVIDYEEGNERSRSFIKSAYPRIMIHPYIRRITEYLKKELDISGSHLFMLPNQEAAEVVAFLSKTDPQYYSFSTYSIAVFPENAEDDAINYFAFMKHCGLMIFSREAEDILKLLELEVPVCTEDSDTIFSENKIKNVLFDGYGSGELFITNSGMNAIYTGYRVITYEALKEDKDIIIILGWAYADTISIFKKCSKDFIMIPNVYDLHTLEHILEKSGKRVSAIFIETVSNPLIAVPDIPYLYELSRKYSFLIMCDNTFATPWNVNISNYCDIIFESLTKYASGAGDVMAGAIFIPSTSRITVESLTYIKNSYIPLYKRDLNRLAFLIKDYKERVEQVSKNAYNLVNRLNTVGSIGSVYSVYSPEAKINWDKIKKNETSFCGVISVVPNCELSTIYNSLNLPKGPSLGSNFHLVMPYTLLAHYNETKTEDGLAYLDKIGLSPNLLRISVGTDSEDIIIKEFSK